MKRSNWIGCISFILAMSIGLGANVFAQGMIVNELSNGQGGSKEFIELLVIGSAADPTADVDLRGWIIDDNNGDFEASASGKGIASGNLRFAQSCFQAVSPGTLILIYNNADPNLNLPADDPGDSNKDCIFISPISNSCFESCSARPNTGTTSYLPCTYSAGVFTRIGMKNGGDAVQVRTPSMSFFHGFSYGDIGAPFPTFPAALGGGLSFNVSTGSGSNRAYVFSCGNYANSANYSRISAAGDTPGAANNAQNAFVIMAIRNGTYDYSNLGSAVNCGSLPSITPCVIFHFVENSFSAKAVGESAQLNWEYKEAEFRPVQFDLQRSTDGVAFENIGVIGFEKGKSVYQAWDHHPMPANYYRMRVLGSNGGMEYSEVVFFSMQGVKGNIIISPNPSNGKLNLKFDMPNIVGEQVEIRVFDVTGRQVFAQQKLVPQHAFELPLQLNGKLGVCFLEVWHETRLLKREKLLLLGN